MWKRVELKAQAKVALRDKYWECLVACLIVAAISGASSLIVSFIPVINVFGSIAITIFVISPLLVGANFFFMQNRLAPPQLRNLFYAFDGIRYSKIVGAMAWKTLFIFLWAMIPAIGFGITFSAFFISGVSSDLFYNNPIFFDSSWVTPIVVSFVIYLAGMIIVIMKQIAYSMTNYILTDNPYIGYEGALKLSITLTYGSKWRIFVLWLSFIGWYLLSALTLFLGVVFLTPYIYATEAELYVRLREEAIRNGHITPQELNLILVSVPDVPSDDATPEN